MFKYSTTATDCLKRDKPTHPKKRLELCLGIPPSKNHAFFYRQGAKHKKANTRKYENEAKSIIRREIAKQDWTMQKESTWFVMEIRLYQPDRRRRDSHNILEILMDVLEELVYHDDYYVLPRVMLVDLDKEDPRVELEIYPL